jgi:two-component system cell cycle sensor histidine kinase/response regulator CckA
MMADAEPQRPRVLVIGGSAEQIATIRTALAGANVEIEVASQTDDVARQRLDKMDALARLAGGVAHDFNNILTAVLGYSEMLVDELPEGDQRRRDAQEIYSAAQRGSAITQQMLAFSRRQVLHPSALDMNAFLRDLEPMLKHAAGDGLTLGMKLASAAGQVRVDRSQFEQAIATLVARARTVMPDGGRLTFSTSIEELDDAARAHGAAAGSYLRLDVTDSGSEIDARTRTHIFEPFYAAPERGKGAALTLAAVYGLTRQSGGFAEVRSDNPGTTFSLYLPLTTSG